MRNTLYRQMVYWINMYRTWIKVADDNLYKEHIISRSDRTDYVVSRTLVLRAFKANGQYAEGTTWEIPEHELDRALATHRKQDASFRQRIKKAAMYPRGCRGHYPLGDLRYCPPGTRDTARSRA